MISNRKLTGVLRGRTAVRVESYPATTIVHFDDGSAMTVHTGPGVESGTSSPSVAPSPGQPPSGAFAALGRVTGVRQGGTTVQLDFDGGASLVLRTAEPSSSVMVRANDHALEYAD